ncbi:MAG: dihydroorotate dehydrogenase (quinone), partial [Planctomycetota bacterium]
MYSALKPILFRIPPEQAHHWTLKSLSMTLSIPVANAFFRSRFRLEHPKLNQTVFGLPLPNPVGLAAGFYKDGPHYQEMTTLG